MVAFLPFKMKAKMIIILKQFFSLWKNFVVVLAPLLLSPLIAGKSEARCGFVILLMAIYWVTEALPIPITSMLPILLFPLLEIMDTDTVCQTYMKETNMMFVGGLIVAIAVEHCDLHQRVALRGLLFFGTSPRLLMLGLMLPTMFLSMWISNTATTAMMVPIVEGVLAVINVSGKDMGKLEDDEEEDKVRKEKDIQAKNIRKMLYLSIAYASNVGGTGTLTGTGPNLVLKGQLSTLFGGETLINFATWMGFAVPIMLLNTMLTWMWLQYYFMGVPWGKNKIDMGDKNTLRQVLQEKYNNLDRMSFHQASVLFFFIILVLLWFFREPQFILGWGDFFVECTNEIALNSNNTTSDINNLTALGNTAENLCTNPKQIVDDASAAVFIVFMLFIFPSKVTFWPFVPISESKSSPALIDWKKIQERFPWGIMFLLGGGFALAKGAKVSGLSIWMGQQMTVLGILPQGLIVLIICVLTAAVTEVTSNVTTSQILLPVLAELAKSTNVNPLYYMLPATITCSYAFMLPVATPPNAIIFAPSGMSTYDMMKVGIVMNLLCIAVTMAALNSYGIPMFGLDQVPNRLNESSTIFVQ